jgi:hypothetical protein
MGPPGADNTSPGPTGTIELAFIVQFKDPTGLMEFPAKMGPLVAKALPDFPDPSDRVLGMTSIVCHSYCSPRGVDGPPGDPGRTNTAVGPTGEHVSCFKWPHFNVFSTDLRSRWNAWYAWHTFILHWSDWSCWSSGLFTTIKANLRDLPARHPRSLAPLALPALTGSLEHPVSMVLQVHSLFSQRYSFQAPLEIRVRLPPKF